MARQGLGHLNLFWDGAAALRAADEGRVVAKFCKTPTQAIT